MAWLGYSRGPMNEAVVSVRGLEKTYKVHERETGVGETVRGFFNRKFKDVPAVGGIDFAIARGEVVGFLGPNGAGKTTTLKMLSGLLYPTGGDAQVLAFTPWRRDYAFLRRIDYVVEECPLVAGNTQLRYKAAMNQLEQTSPGTKAQFLMGFIDHGSKLFRSEDTAELAPCERCGQPTTGRF